MVDLTHCFLPKMLERQAGGVINVASIAGFQPIPYMAVYAASKAFVISFSVALREECRDRNVRVLALCPGTTDTPFFDIASAPEAALGRKRSPQQVVATALRVGTESKPRDRRHDQSSVNPWPAADPKMVSRKVCRPRCATS